jgi:hypothetical protein
MKTKPKTPTTNFVVLLYLLALASMSHGDPGTEFTFQGRLADGATPIEVLVDVRYSLWDDETSSAPINQVGSDISVTDMYDGGIVQQNLDFGTGSFDGQPRWLEIELANPSGGTFELLTPRIELLPTPYTMVANQLTSGTYLHSGKLSQTTLIPTDPGDLATKSYVDSLLGSELGRTVFVVPDFTQSASPDGSLGNPFDNLADAFAYAESPAFTGTYFGNRVAIIMMPGQHFIDSTVTLDNPSIDVAGFGWKSTTISGSASPLIIMEPTSGATIRNVNFRPSGATNTAVVARGGRLEEVAFRRDTGAPAGTLLTVDVPTSPAFTFSIQDFEIFGGVSILSYGAQTSFSQGFVTDTIFSTGTSPTGTELLTFTNMSTIGGFAAFVGGLNIVSFNDVQLVSGISYAPGLTLLIASNTQFGAPIPNGVPPFPITAAALLDPAPGSYLRNCVADVSAWTGVVTPPPLSTNYTAFTAK